jgi:hypothetical protein
MVGHDLPEKRGFTGATRSDHGHGLPRHAGHPDVSTGQQRWDAASEIDNLLPDEVSHLPFYKAKFVNVLAC